MKKQFISEAQRLQKLAGINEAKIVPQNMMQQEKIPEGWEEEKGDKGEYWNGNIIIREYYREDPHLDEYHTVYILKRPNDEYYANIKTSGKYTYQSDPFNSFDKAREYTFNEMYNIMDAEGEGELNDDEEPDRYDED